jgi:hypothetical protein
MSKEILCKILAISSICLFISVCVQPAFANEKISVGKAEQQSSSVTFIKYYGGRKGNHVQQTTDGGYIITGQKYIYYSQYVWLIKTDSYGNILWNRTLGGGDWAEGNCVQQTTDGGYIIAAHRYIDLHEEGGALLIKTNSNGSIEWERTFGGWSIDEARYVQQTNDGGYIIIARTDNYPSSSVVWLIKTDSNGNKEWEKIFDRSGNDEGFCVQQTTDGGYIIVGTTDSFDRNVWLIKTDSNGNKEWNKVFGGTFVDEGFCVQQTTDGGYIITGYTTIPSIFEYTDVLLIKTDSSGNKEWEKTFGERYDDEEGYSVQQTTDGGYIITGENNYDVWLIKTDSSGNKEWDNTFRGIRGFCVQQTTDGGYIITGDIRGVGLIKTDMYGKSRNKAVTDNMLLLRILERFPPLERLLVFIQLIS